MSVFPFAPATTTPILRICVGAFLLSFILCGSTEGQIQRIFRALRGEPAPVEMQDVGEAAFAVADEVAIAVEEGPEAEAKGPLADMAPVLKQAATLVVRDDRLVVDELASSNDFQQAMYSDSHLFGGGGTSSSSNGKNWKMSFNWQLLKGRAEFSTGEATQMLIDATEQGGQLKHMRYEITGEESIELMLWSPRTPEFLRLKQDGALLTIVFVQGEVTLSVRGTSLSETLRKIPADSRPAMLASLRSTGFPLPPTPYDAAIVAGLIEKLTSSLDPDEAAIFAELASGFDDDD